MAAETGHHPNRSYTDQSGNIHLNGASLFDANESDLGGNVAFRVGSVVNSSGGLTSITTGLTSITAAFANPISTAMSSAAGIPQFCNVGYSTGAGTLEVLALKYTATAGDPKVATSTAVLISWAAFGTV